MAAEGGGGIHLVAAEARPAASAEDGGDLEGAGTARECNAADLALTHTGATAALLFLTAGAAVLALEAQAFLIQLAAERDVRKVAGTVLADARRDHAWSRHFGKRARSACGSNSFAQRVDRIRSTITKHPLISPG